MVVGIIVASALLIGVAVTVVLVTRDVRRLHRSGRKLTDQPSDIGGMSAAGVSAIGNNVTH